MRDGSAHLFLSEPLNLNFEKLEDRSYNEKSNVERVNFFNP